MTLDARESGPFSGVRSTTLAVTAPLRSTVRWAVSPLGSAWQGIAHYDDVQDENNVLRSRVAELEGQLAQVPDNRADLQALREATKVDFAEQYGRVTGQVVSDRQTGLERIVEINRGSNDGLAVGMPVVTGNGLVGQIVSVSGGRSSIRVMSDPRLHVGVVSKRSRIVGVTSGGGDGNNLVIDLLDNAANQVTDRTRFETSGFDASPYPGGIPVGFLVLEDGQISIRPSADLDRLSFLTVLLYTPESEEVVSPGEGDPSETPVEAGG